MKTIFKSLVLLCLLCFAYDAKAQQQQMFTQYMFNGLALNPAYAGSHESASLTALARTQWVGLEGAPDTQTFSAHSPLRNNNSAVGVLFVRDQIGVTTTNNLFASYAYRVSFPGGGKLSFGVQGGMTNYQSNLTELTNRSGTDPVFQSDDIDKMLPNVGAGVYFYTNKFYVGASVPMILSNYFSDDRTISSARQYRHYFLQTGFVLPLNRFVKIKPNILVKAVEAAPVEFDLNLNVLLREVLWLGVSYRSFDSVDAIVQLQLTKNIALGYSFDFLTTTDLAKVQSGSHELMLNYRFNLGRSRILTPRYF